MSAIVSYGQVLLYLQTGTCRNCIAVLEELEECKEAVLTPSASHQHDEAVKDHFHDGTLGGQLPMAVKVRHTNRTIAVDVNAFHAE